jgi:hypothetical protein
MIRRCIETPGTLVEAHIAIESPDECSHAAVLDFDTAWFASRSRSIHAVCDILRLSASITRVGYTGCIADWLAAVLRNEFFECDAPVTAQPAAIEFRARADHRGWLDLIDDTPQLPPDSEDLVGRKSQPP